MAEVCGREKCGDSLDYQEEVVENHMCSKAKRRVGSRNYIIDLAQKCRLSTQVELEAMTSLKLTLSSSLLML